MEEKMFETFVSVLLALFEKGLALVPKIKKCFQQRNAFEKCKAALASICSNEKNKKDFNKWVDKELKYFFYMNKGKIPLQDLMKALIEKTADKVTYYNIDPSIKDEIAMAIKYAILEYYRENLPNEYHNYKLDIIENNLLKFEENQEAIISDLTQLLKKGEIFTIDQYLESIIQEHQNKKLSLSFFSTDDDNFSSQLQFFLEKPYFTILTQDNEEAIGTTLQTLKTLGLAEKTLIIRTESSWEEYEKSGKSGHILLADFYSNSTPHIQNNTCIFFSKKQVPGPLLALRRRKKSTIKERLKDEGLTTDEIVELMRDTNGFYFAIKNKLYSGNIQNYYPQIELSHPLLKCVLLYGGWRRDSDDELEVINYTSLPKEVFSSQLNTLLNSNPPLLIQTSIYGNTFIELTSVLYAWFSFGEIIGIQDFIDFCERTLSLFSSNYKAENSSISMLGNILETISFVVNVYHHDWQNIGDYFSKKLLMNSLTEHFTYQLLKDYGNNIVEISPEAFLDFVRNHSSDLQEMISAEKDIPESIFMFLFDDLLISQLRQILLFGDDYALRAYQQLIDMCSWNLRAKTLDKIHSILSETLIPWFNFSGVDLPIRQQMIKSVHDKLPNNSCAIFIEAETALIGPPIGISEHYRPLNEEFKASSEDKYSIYEALTTYLISEADSQQILDILDDHYFYTLTTENVETLLDNLNNRVSQLDDISKIQMEMKIREFIFTHKYFEEINTQNSQYVIERLEALVNDICYDNKTMKLLFVLLHDYFFFPLLDPTPKSADNHEELNKQKYEELLRKVYAELLDMGISLQDYFQTYLDVHSRVSSFTSSLDPLYKFVQINLNNSFDKDLFYTFLHLGLNDLARFYLGLCMPATEDLVSFFESEQDSDLKGLILSSQSRIDMNIVDILSQSNEDVKNSFWEKAFVSSKDASLIRKLAVTFPTNNLPRQCMFFVLEHAECFDLNFIIDFLATNISVLQANSNLFYSIDHYLTQHLFEMENNIDLLEKATQIELTISNNVSRNFSCLELLILKKPYYYCELLSYIFKCNKASIRKTNLEKETAFKIFFALHFCPGYFNNKATKPSFTEWVDEFKTIASDQFGFEKSFVSSRIASLLPNAPQESLPLPLEICEYIENNYSDSLCSAFITAEINNQGLHTVNGGEYEKERAQYYFELSNSLKKEGFLKCSQLFKLLWKDYTNESEKERTRAENE